MKENKLLLETSKIAWHDLQRFFAGGSVLKIGLDMDLVEVAYQLSVDNKMQVEQWLTDRKLNKVSDQQALIWYEENVVLWAVVVKPWILVQEIR